MPHRLPWLLCKVARGLLQEEVTNESSDSKWLHNRGYLTCDMIPYYVRHWHEPDWTNPEAVRLVRRHILACLKLMMRGRIALILFTGKPWQNLWIDKPAFGAWSNSLPHKSFKLRKVPGHRSHGTRIFRWEAARGKRRCPQWSLGRFSTRSED